MPNNFIIIPVGVTTKKNIIPITIGAIKFPKKIPNLNHNLFKGVRIFEFIKPNIRNIIEIIKDHNLISSPFNKGHKAIKQSCEDQKKGITTFIEIILNQELGEPFRRDAMKKPVEVAGIKKNDMKPQKSLI